MRFWTITFYFAFAIIFLASIGVSLPCIIDAVNSEPNLYKNLNQNLVTYFIAILISASLDYIMRLIDDTVAYKKLAILVVCIGNTIIILMASYILYFNSTTDVKGVSWLAIFGVIVAYIMWWVSNYKNSVFDPVNAPLGGDAAKQLSNG